MASSSLLRPGLKTAFAEALYNEIVSNTSGYYYFIGRPQDTTTGVGATLASENEVRRDAVFYKKITGADVTLTVPRVDWQSGTVYDIYDDQLGDYAEIEGKVTRSVGTFNPGGTDVDSDNDTITIQYTGYYDGPTYVVNELSTGDLVVYDSVDNTTTPVNGLTLGNQYYCKVTTTTPLTKVKLYSTRAEAVTAGATSISISSIGTTANHSLTRNSVTGSFDLDTFGKGWTVQTTIDGTLYELGTVVMGSTGSILLSSGGDIDNGAAVTLSITNKSYSGARYLEDANFYVVNSEYNVYKCLDNNNNSPSTVRPYSTSHEAFQTSDGYVWKYMYSIPTALVNKFVSDTDIPVATAVKNPYYSNGAINAVQVIKQGSGYSTSDGLLVLGDGSRTDNVYKLIALTVTNNGSGYGSGATGISIDPPVSADPWQPSTSFAAGRHLIVNSSNIIYQVVTTGVSGATAPTHTYGTATNGTMSVKFAGIKATATANHTVSGSTGYQISSTTFTNGNLAYINVTNPGSGYVTAPQVQIYGGGTGALATSTLTGSGYVANIVVSAKGTGYTSGSSVTLDAPAAGGSQAYATVEIYNGYGYKDVPLVTVPAPFTADLQYADGATGIHNQIFQYGSKFFRITGATGYLGSNFDAGATGFTQGSTGPTVSYYFIGETATIEAYTEKTRAQLSPVVYNGQIVGTIVQDGGAGYTVATVTPLTAGGSGAELLPSLSYGDLNTYQATTELMATPGTIDKIIVMHSGYGYTTGSTGVTVTGDGTGCAAYATIVDGLIAKIIVTDPGQNYTYANVTIASPVSGMTAIGRAIIAPATGHGHDAVKELFAKDLATSTTLGSDLNQGIVVTNDYSQLGIVKNPEDYTTGLRYNEQTGSPCFVLGATGVNGFAGVGNDLIITDSVTADRYRVIQPSGDYSSVLVQSLDNKVPVVGDVLAISNTFATIGTVTVPNIDKYSGQLLYVDTESSSFKSSIEESISVKTVIRL